MRTLGGGDLVLEPQVAAHAPVLFAILHQPGVYDFLDEEPPLSLEEWTERVAGLERRRSPDGSEHWLNWAIVHRGEVVGFVQATVSGDAAMIAYLLGSVHWGGGLASSATALMLDELKTGYGVRIASATVHARNDRSIRLLQRLGFEERPVRTSDLKFEKTL
jgi:[ribosomal protein S5]-alanine N-acetyltransferase